MSEKKKSFKRFLVSKVFFKNLALAIGITLIVLIIVQGGLKIYTDHGKEIIIPDYSGLSLAEADKLCFEQNLKWVIMDSLYLESQPGGVIPDQYFLNTGIPARYPDIEADETEVYPAIRQRVPGLYAPGKDLKVFYEQTY